MSKLTRTERTEIYINKLEKEVSLNVMVDELYLSDIKETIKLLKTIYSMSMTAEQIERVKVIHEDIQELLDDALTDELGDLTFKELNLIGNCCNLLESLEGTKLTNASNLTGADEATEWLESFEPNKEVLY